MNSASTVRLHTGREMPVIGLGTWELTHATSATVEYALNLGYRMIDINEHYSSLGSSLQYV